MSVENTILEIDKVPKAKLDSGIFESQAISQVFYASKIKLPSTFFRPF